MGSVKAACIDMPVWDDKIDFVKSPSIRPRRDFVSPVLCLSVLGFICLSLATGVVAQSGAAEAAENDPRVSKLYHEAAEAEARGDLAGAAASYESLLQIAPRLAPAYNNLGSLYIRQREYRKAEKVLKRGLEVDPKMWSASALLGI